MKKGQVMIYGIMLFVMVFIVMVIFTKPMKDMSDTARDVDHLNCSSSVISTGTKLTCLVVDLQLFFFVATVLGAAYGYIHLRRTEG